MPSQPYDHLEISARYFFPEVGPPPPWESYGGPVVLEVEQMAISCFHAPALVDASRPTLLYFHGNGEQVVHQLGHWPDWCRATGLNALFVDYPGYGASSGEPTLSSCAASARSALDWLLAQLPKEHGVIIGGRSVGSIFALDAAAYRRDDPRVLGLFLESAIADVLQRVDLRIDYAALGLDRPSIAQALERDFDQRGKLATLCCPVLVLHTVNDGLVECEHGERLATWAGKNLFSLELFSTGDHNSIQFFNEAAYKEALGRFVSHCVTRRGPPPGGA